MAVGREAFGCHDEQAAASVERVVLAAPVPHRVVLDTMAALIHGRVRGAHDVEGIGDQNGRGQHGVEPRTSSAWTRRAP